MSLSVTPTGRTPIYLYTAPADMRKRFVGLRGLIESAPGGSDLDVLAGGLFVFVNRRRDRMKVRERCRCIPADLRHSAAGDQRSASPHYARARPAAARPRPGGDRRDGAGSGRGTARRGLASGVP